MIIMMKNGSTNRECIFCLCWTRRMNCCVADQMAMLYASKYNTTPFVFPMFSTTCRSAIGFGSVVVNSAYNTTTTDTVHGTKRHCYIELILRRDVMCQLCAYVATTPAIVSYTLLWIVDLSVNWSTTDRRKHCCQCNLYWAPKGVEKFSRLSDW